MSSRKASVTVIAAAEPNLKTSCPKRTKFLSISINTATGYVYVQGYEDVRQARLDFGQRGDPPTWRGLQILKVET